MPLDRPSLADTLVRAVPTDAAPVRRTGTRAARAATVLGCALAVAALVPACSDRSATGTDVPEGSAAPVAATASAEAPPPILAEPLTGRHLFDPNEDVAIQFRLQPDGKPVTVVNQKDPSRWTVLKITVQPGARFPWHVHPGPVIVGVTTGDLVLVYADDCVRRPHPGGTVFVDPGNQVHYAYNPGTTPTVLTATFFGVPATGPVTIPVPADQAAANDAKCISAPALANAHAGH